MSPSHFFDCRPKFTQFFFAQRGRGNGWSILSDVRNVDPFRRYSRSKSKVVRYRGEIWTFSGPPKFFGVGLPKVVRALSPLPRGMSGEVSWGYSHQPRSYWGVKFSVWASITSGLVGVSSRNFSRRHVWRSFVRILPPPPKLLGRKIQRVSLNNFRAGGSILTKLLQTTCREAGVITRVQLLEGPPPKI